MRSPWHHEPRAGLTEQQAAKLFLEHGGRCWRCRNKIGATELRKKWTVGHMLALELGGTNAWENLAPECELCKPISDAADHKAAGHARRVATLAVLPRELRKKTGLSKKPGYKFNWRAGRYEREDTDPQ